MRVQVDEHIRQVLRAADGKDGDIARAVPKQAERGAFRARADLSKEQLEALYVRASPAELGRASVVVRGRWRVACSVACRCISTNDAS